MTGDVGQLAKASLLVATLFGYVAWKRISTRNAAKINDEAMVDVVTALEQREAFTSLSLDPKSLDRLNSSGDTHLPCCLVCGPLGSGKTTLLRFLLQSIRDYGDFKCGAIVNDFADLGVDVERITEDDNSSVTMAVSDGCCCCSVSSTGTSDAELKRALAAMRSRADVDCVLVECSGLSEASGARAQLAGLTRLDSVLGILDASSFPPSTWKDKELLSFCHSCDVVLLNKCDLCEETRLAEIEKILKQHGAVKIVRTHHSRIPLDASFRVAVHNPELSSVGVSAAERKASTRYSLLNDNFPALNQATNICSAPPSEHLNSTSWLVMTKDYAAIDSLGRLQNVITKWWKNEQVLKRVKGKVWLEGYPGSFELQYSGRCRLQMIPAPTRSVRMTRLAVISEDRSDLQVLDELTVKEDCIFERAERLSLLRMLGDDIRLTVMDPMDPSAIRFSVDCKRKFGFSREELSQRFGVDLDDVNLDFQRRVNAADGPILVAFDGEAISVSCGLHLKAMEVYARLSHELDAILAVKFAVVARYCRCDG